MQDLEVSFFFQKGLYLNRTAVYDAAVISYDRVVKLQPDYSDAWYNRGNALYHLKRYKEAIASYDQALEYEPGFSEAWNNRGSALMI